MTFKEALNDAIRTAAVAEGVRREFRTETAAMGESSVNLDRALLIAGELEDDDLLRKMRSGS